MYVILSVVKRSLTLHVETNDGTNGRADLVVRLAHVITVMFLRHFADDQSAVGRHVVHHVTELVRVFAWNDKTSRSQYAVRITCCKYNLIVMITCITRSFSPFNSRLGMSGRGAVDFRLVVSHHVYVLRLNDPFGGHYKNGTWRLVIAHSDF